MSNNDCKPYFKTTDSISAPEAAGLRGRTVKKKSLRKIWTDFMPCEADFLLKVGDLAEFHRGGHPQPQPEWHAQVVQEIRITEEYEDKEGKLVAEVSWGAIRNYECMVIVLGTENWARNDQVRPTAKAIRAAKRKGSRKLRE
jgi:hypothetical protein